MTLNADNDKQPKKKPTPKADAPQQSGGFREHYNPGAGEERMSTAELFAGMAGIMPQKVSSGDVNQFAEAIQERYQKSIKDAGIVKSLSVDVLDSETHRLSKSAVLVIMVIGKKIAVHSLIVASSGEPLINHQFNTGSSWGKQGNQQRVVRAVPGDVYDDNWFYVVESHIKRVYGKDLEVMDASVEVIPEGTRPDDEAAIQGMAYNAFNAVYSMLATAQSNQTITARQLANGDRITCRVDYHAQQTTTAAGLPVRQDFTVNLAAVNSEKGKAYSAQQTLPLTCLGGFMDLIYAPRENAQAQFGAQFMNQPIDTRVYMPRMVITANRPLVTVNTLEMQLLSLSTATTFANQNSWVNMFRPSHQRGRKKSINLRDVGAIGFEWSPTPDATAKPQRIKTEVDSFSEQAFLTTMGAAFHQELGVCMDFEEAGDQTWLQRIMRYAAEGNSECNQMLLAAADRLCAGNFIKNLPDGHNTSFFTGEVNRIHNGVWTNEDGELRDIRECDYLGVLNRWGERDLEVVAKWDATFDPSRGHPVERLEDRERVLVETLGDTVEITGYSIRATVNPVALCALSKGIADCGLTYTPENFMAAVPQQARGNQNALAYGLAANAAGNVWNSGFQQAGYGAGNMNWGPRQGW